jgi:crotonobetainyl-CoA:carnitine CoA-transferase CaiB-like acyl-CoA transferase
MAQPDARKADNGASVPRLPLAGVVTVECGQGVAAAFATKLLAMLGAEVIKVESPQGDLTRRRGPFLDDAYDPEASGLFLYLNADKYGVVLDLNSASARERLDDLLAQADILIHNIPVPERAALRMETDAVCRSHPGLIVAGISPFGDQGPYAHYKAYELNVAHASGMASVGPGGSPFPELPPLKLFGQQAEFQGALNAAMAVTAAYFARMKTGAGQGIEVSEHECMTAILEGTLVQYTYAGREATRLGRYAYGPRAIFPCADGWMHINLAEEAQWQRFVELMGNPEWTQEEIFKDRFARGANRDALEPILADWTRNWKMLDLYLAAQTRHVPVAPVNRASDVYADGHLRARNFFGRLPLPDSKTQTVEVPTVPFKSTATGWRLSRAAPRLGEHQQEILARQSRRSAAPVAETQGRSSEGPLSGIRVLDFSWVWAAPFCTMQLAYMGAEVIRVESTKRMCVARGLPPFADRQPGPNRAGLFNQWNQGKRSIQLNLAMPQAAAIVRELVRRCDVVVENFSPGTIARMGFGYEALRQHRPDLIMASLSGYGQTGPYSKFVNYGPQIGSQSGLYAMTGYPQDRPREGPVAYGDPSMGLTTAFLINAALIHRARTGEGQYLDVAMWEVLEMVSPEMLLEFAMNRRDPSPMGNHDAMMAPHNCYKALGDAEKWVSIAVGSEAEWRALCAAIGQPSLAEDPRFLTAALRKRNEEELDRLITQWTAQRDRWEITEILQRCGVAAFPTLNNKDVALDPHLTQRGFLVQLEHPEVGRRIHSGVPWTMSATPCRVHKPAPVLGADTDQVLTELLGYSRRQIEDLRAADVLT